MSVGKKIGQLCLAGCLMLLGLSLINIPLARLIPGAASAQVTSGLYLIKSDEESVVLELYTPAYQVEEKTVDGMAYHLLSIKGYGETSKSGKPQLPIKGVMLGVPPDAELEVHVLESYSSVAAERYNVCPVPQVVIQGSLHSLESLQEPFGLSSSSIEYVFAKDEGVYSTDAFYPTDLVEVASSGYLRDQRYVQVLVRPVQYNPVTGELKHHRYIKLQVSFSYPQGPLAFSPSRAESPVFEIALKNSILNYETAKHWRACLQPQVQAMSATLDYLNEPTYKISVTQDGIYQLTYSYLQAAGLPIDSLDPRAFQLFNMGSEVAIYVEGEDDGSFDPDDYILFYGQKMNTKYTDTNVYWLTYGEAAGLRMGTKDGTPSDASSPTSFKATIHLEEDHKYRPHVRMQEGADHWYWNYFSAPSLPTQSYTTTLNNIATDSYSATLRSIIDGFTTGEHHLDFYINGHHDESLVANWYGKTGYAGEISFPQSYLVEGVNTIEITATSGSADVGFINWFEIDYHDTYVAENNSLRFSGDEAGTWEYHVDGFTMSDIEAFDITNPVNVSRIINTAVEPSSSYTLKFEDTIADRMEYLTLTTSQHLSPPNIVLDMPSDLHSTNNGADYIFITHNDFYGDVLPLANHRATQGLRTMVVDVQDIYDEFSYGIFDPQAIHDFLAYAYASWTVPAPTYILLVGDGNYDFKDNLGTAEPNYIPPYLAMVDPTNGEVAADNRYVCVSGGDILADMHIGRLPVQTNTQANTVVNKIINYEQNPPSGNWNHRVLFVADNYPDPAGNFPELSDDIANNYLPASYAVDKVYLGLDDYPYENPAVTARAAIVAAINEGRLLTNYVGHAAIYYWAHEKLFRIEDIASLSNDRELPMMLPMACYDGYFNKPGDPCLGESVVRASGKGAIASWSPTGAGLAAGHHYLGQGFFTAVFTDNISEIGTATYLGKLKLYTETGGEASPFRDLMDTFVLFGDPFMKLNLPLCDAADYDNDGRITVADVMQVAAHWDTQWGDANFDRKYDLDDDGDVDIVDVMWVAGRWEEVC